MSLESKNSDNMKLGDVTEFLKDAEDVVAVRELPEVIFSFVNKYIRGDWLGLNLVRNATPHVFTYNASFNPKWWEIHRSIIQYDYVSNFLNETQEGSIVYKRTFQDKADASKLYMDEMIDKYTGIVNVIAANVIKNSERHIILALNSTDKNLTYDDHDSKILSLMLPFIRKVIQPVLLYEETDFIKCGMDRLLSSENVSAVLFDDALKPIHIAPELRDIVEPFFPKEKFAILPEPIMNWIHHVVAPNGILIQDTGSWTLSIGNKIGQLSIEAHAIKSGTEKMHLLVKVKYKASATDFSALETLGLTPREIETVSYLPLGYTNTDIADAMGIQEVTVKKNLARAANKLGATGRTETLYRAMKFKENLS